MTTTSLPFSSGGIDEITVWVRRGSDAFSEDPDKDEDLTIEYLNASSVWVELDTFNGNGSAGRIFEETYALPASGQHSNFQIRFTLALGEGDDFDYWHVDDLCFNGAVPDFNVVKSVEVERDPINEETNPLGIPGAWAVYSITVTNNGDGGVDAGSMIISDTVPANTSLFTGDFDGAGSPFRFTDGNGSSSSGLSLNFVDLTDATDDIVFRNTSGTSITPNGDFDPAVDSFELQFTGAMNGASGGGAPTFTIEYRVLIE